MTAGSPNRIAAPQLSGALVDCGFVGPSAAEDAGERLADVRHELVVHLVSGVNAFSMRAKQDRAYLADLGDGGGHGFGHGGGEVDVPGDDGADPGRGEGDATGFGGLGAG